MVQILALIAAIVLVVVLQQLRAILAAPFPRYVWRALPSARPPAAWADLFELAEGELRTLGFEGPQWVLVEAAAGESVENPLRAIYRHQTAATWLMLSVPTGPQFAHRLQPTYFSRLQDGRVCCSQPFEAWSTVMSDERWLGRILDARDFAGQLQQHRQWVTSEGEIDRDWLRASALPELLVELPERQRQALLARGELRAGGPDVATPSWGFARHLRRVLRQCPKPADNGELPAARLAYLAERSRRIAHRSPPANVQWILFGQSVLLFVALGWVFWDLQFAALLLIVIAFHESGHFLAMRAFGYRNVHMLMLPLIGGVAMGHDAQPNAWRRAWMSLMGPLPGILLGWVLLLLLWQQPDGGDSWLWTLGWLLLFVNYLNILPVPPLDGSHVVQSLLPHRLAWLQVGFVAVAAVTGGLLAVWLGFPFLALLAALQLPALFGRWRLLQLARIADDQVAGLTQPQQRLTVLAGLVQQGLPPAPAAQQVQQVLALADVVETRPMRPLQRLVIAVVYAILAIVPLFGVLLVAGWQGASEPSGELEDWEQEQAALSIEAQALPLAALLTGLEMEEVVVAPASEAALAAARDRLGRDLPEELLALYQLSNGLPALSLAPVEDIAAAGPVLQPRLSTADPMLNVLYLWSSRAQQSLEIPAKALENWWWIGTDEEGQTQLYYQPDPAGAIEGIRLVIDYTEGGTGYRDLRDYLESSWVDQRQLARQQQHIELAQQAAQVRLASADVTELLVQAEQAQQVDGWTARVLLWLYSDAASEDVPGVGAAVLGAAQSRLGPLPADLQQIYAHSDGLPLLGLGPLADIDRLQVRASSYARGLPDRLLAQLQACESCRWREPLPEAGALTAHLGNCLDLSPASATEYGPMDLPTLLWCDPQTPYPGWYDVGKGQRFASATEALRARVAQLQAMRTSF